MKRIKLSLLSVVLSALISALSSCNSDEEITFSSDKEGVLTSMPYQWKTSLSTDGGLIYGFIRESVFYENNVLFASQDGETSKMSMVSAASGKVLWQWNDLFENDRRFHISRKYLHHQYFAFQMGSRAYTIDLSTGKTIRKITRNHHVGGMTGIEDSYFVTGTPAGEEKTQPYVGAIYTGKIYQADEHLVLTPDFSYQYIDGNGVGGFVTGINSFRDEAGDVLLAYSFADPLPEWSGDIYAGLYNYTQNKEIFSKQLLAGGVTSYAAGTPIFYKDKIYHGADASIFCFNRHTGELVWKRDFPEGFTFSGYIIADGKLLANCEDRYLYALDPQTGNQLWKEKSSGSSSRMVHMHGVVYFVGGGDGLLHAVDIATGKHLWRILSPDLKVNRGAWFMPVVTVLPPENEGEKGKVLVSSYLSAFCYEAAR